jgi:hypothetical protein
MFKFFKRGNQNSKLNFVNQLESLEYFEFVNENEIPILKDKIHSSFEKAKFFTTAYDKSGNPICKKYYRMDSERLLENDGFSFQLKEMKIGLELICDFDSILEVLPVSSNADSQFEAVIDFIKKINSFLNQNGLSYQLYPAYGGNEGSVFILNAAQFELINREIEVEHTRPLLLDDWIQRYKPRDKDQNVTEQNPSSKFKEGMVVNHQKYGEGLILKITERGLATIKFQAGEKNIILKFSNLKLLR